MRKEVYEKLVIDKIKEEILSEQGLDKISTLVLATYEKEAQQPKTSTDKLKRELDKNKKAQSKLLDLYLTDKISNDLLDQKNAILKKEEVVLEKEIKKNIQLENSSRISKEDVCKFIKAYFEDLPTDDYIKNRMLVNTFIQEIAVFKDSLIITFKVNLNAINGLSSSNQMGVNVTTRGNELLITPITFDLFIERINTKYNNNACLVKVES